MRVFRIEIAHNDRFGIQICEGLILLNIKGASEMIVEVHNSDRVYFDG